MSDEYLVRNCAPTLAGIKTANLFTCPVESQEALRSSLRRVNKRLKGKGIRVLPLRYYDNRALIYIYRPGHLAADLTKVAAQAILKQCGYCVGSCEKCVCQLARKLRQQPGFPHEIGLFLGYPPEDVAGFMEQGPEGCKCTGCWKVYGDEASARKKFAQYKKCTRVYCDQWARGRDIEHLTVPTRVN